MLINQLSLLCAKFYQRIEIIHNTCTALAKESPYEEDDLRRTIYNKLAQLLTNILIGHTASVNKEFVSQYKSIINPYKDCYIEGFFMLVWRSFQSEVVEQAENLLRAAYGSKNGKWPRQTLAQLMKDLEEDGRLAKIDKDFILEWMNSKRNPRHNNYVDHHKKGDPVLFSLYDLALNEVTDLIKCVERMIASPWMRSLPKVLDTLQTRSISATSHATDS